MESLRASRSIWFEAVVIGLTIAVILSGGEVDLVRGRFRVHALGDGLAKLKALFDRGATRAKKKKRDHAKGALLASQGGE